MVTPLLAFRAPRAARLVLLLFLLLPFGFTTVLAGPAVDSTGGGAASPFTPQVQPSLTLHPAAGAIRIDGELGDEGWAGAALASGFTEVQPGDQVRPRVETEVLAAYDEGHLYLAFRAYDDPATIRASMRNRDEIYADDWVGIILDTYGDGAQAYEIFANPLGIQFDILMSPNGEDMGFDLIYESAGRVTDDGYVVEIAIPFSSLRFPNRPEQAWRATFIRNHPRESRHIYSWATASRDNPCMPCQFGHLEGLGTPESGRRLDVLPAVVGQQSGALAGGDPGQGFDNARFRPQASLNLRYDLSSSLAAEATVNPDFSQVESDAAQVDVNSTFALFYPERRPFFQEGSDLFNTWIDVVYTRSINDPIGAAKVTGRFGRTSVAFLSAVDATTPMLLPFEERSELVQAGRSLSNIVRARHTFDENAFVGATLTDRRLFDGGGGTTISADARYRFLKQYRVQAQLAVSQTQEPEDASLSERVGEGVFADGRHTAALDGERYGGLALYTSVGRSAKHWSFDLGYRAYSPTFRTANGFVTSNDFQSIQMSQNLDIYPRTALVDRVTPGVFVERRLSFDGTQREIQVQPRLRMMLTGQTFVFIGTRFAREQFGGVAFDGIRSWTLFARSDFSERVGGRLNASGGYGITRFLETPVLGRQRSFGAALTLKPLQRLVVQPSFDYAAMFDRETGEAYYEGFILRTQVNLQFTRELSLRLITQYNDFNERLDVEPLVSYRINPFSIFYVGSTHGFNQYADPYGILESDRQLFFKFQYLFRV